MNLDLSPQSLQRSATRAAEIYTEIYARLEDRRVAPGPLDEVTLAELSRGIGDDGVGLDQVLEEFVEHLLPGCMGTPHPLYLGLVNSSPLPAGPLADLLVSSLNNNAGSRHQSPVFSLLEEVVVQQFAQLCGFAEEASGMVLPGGTFANLQGLLLARHVHFPRWLSDGPASLPGRPRLYRSDATHFCNDRAAEVIGIGRSNVVAVASHGRGVMDVDALSQQIDRDRRDGHSPFAVVANAGTTGTGAIDHLDAIASVCEQQKVWLHVDACYGGGALLANPRPQALDGIGRADSVAIDPHKWFFVPMTAGLLLTRHPHVELETFDTPAPYIPTDGIVAPFRRGLPTSRRSSSLTIWMILRAHGWKVIREAIERNVRLTRLLESTLAQAGFRVLGDGQLSVACVRWEPAGMRSSETDRLQAEIAEEVAASGRAWFSTFVHADEKWIRMNLVNIHTQKHHIETVSRLICETARRLSAGRPPVD